MCWQIKLPDQRPVVGALECGMIHNPGLPFGHCNPQGGLLGGIHNHPAIVKLTQIGVALAAIDPTRLAPDVAEVQIL